ncbi:MAG TPA: hypothetical protein VFE11_18925 [Dongiaceae bacterium]|nr:hypothetical protein [Dongiaceae bacterium]
MIDRVIGIDFSGAAAAGRAIWLAEARLNGAGVSIASCRPACELPQSGVAREACLPALVAFVGELGHAVIGCDFPFSLPRHLMGTASWRDYARLFAGRFATAEAFLQDCRERAEGRELRRACDHISRVPFAAYNLRIYRQTYHGIRDVLWPLVASGAAAVLPMEAPINGRPWVVETCPASTLKSLDLYPSYKGRSAAHLQARRRIIDGLVRVKLLAPLPRQIRRTAEGDEGGDALDSIVAAAATARALRAGAFAGDGVDATERLEGRVYF